MTTRALLAALRRREPPDPRALEAFAKGLADRSVSDAQAGAFAMAVCMGGLGPEGRVALTRAMRDSGRCLRWALDGPVLDKHSTGGLGDCVSLVLAPALAACGAYVPMISGRGLGHTGGTLDKLEAIPGVSVDLDEARFRAVVDEAGCAIVGASPDIAPADKRLYAVRDVTATVESLDLITASILSKKLAAGLDGLVLDVKLGSGAFMKTEDDARALAGALVETANAAGCPTQALITDMSQPLAPAMGNALEVLAAVDVLGGRAGGALLDLSCALGGAVLAGAGLADTPALGAAKMREAVEGGAALERFGRMVVAQGGPMGFVDAPARYLPEAPVIREVPAPRDGWITAMAGEALGLATVALGAGRAVETDRVDPAVGLGDILPLGHEVRRGQPLCRIHAAREAQAEEAAATIRAAISIGDAAPDLPPLIHGRVG
ncbi:thymidine phosphorylase [Pseudaestuariivita atlantica]|uniref:Thymidine phosphorylase n=1 Tax=Pseudaestuariivita atlantica TaxID=1317121 RepID=A0A0L1JUU2_9RHOB|nr:thymidine phosphorylase [Pseudaestuariivita atlantica]KNG95178.1 thymidine phosphorylase [Pseudaestuariivita atlantica]